MLRPRLNSNRGRQRDGISTVEFAVTLPLLTLLVFGSIETAHSIQLKQGLTVTAYEAVMVATSQSANEDQTNLRALEIASAFQINNLKIETVPKITPDLPAGTTVTVTVSAPTNSNRIGPNFFFLNRVISVQASMVRL